MKLLLRPYSNLPGLLISILLCLTACQKNDPESCAPYIPPVPADKYVFPIIPGTPAWAALKSGEEMVQVCQVPAPTLRSISTVGLVATCLDYPLLRHMVFFNSLQFGVRVQLANFNGFGELQQRPQAATLLMQQYQFMRPACLPKEEQRSGYTFSFTDLELILAQDEYLTQLSSMERHALVREAVTKYADKQMYIKDVHGVFGLKTTAFVMARVMKLEQYAPFMAAVNNDSTLQLFISDVELQDKLQTLDTVLKYAKEFN